MPTRVLVLGDPRFRTEVTESLDRLADVAATECDPDLGDCVMFVRLESIRYDVFVMLGYDDRATRGALAVVAERSVLIPLVDDAGRLDSLCESYLFRLPGGLGFRTDEERQAVVAAVPDSANVPAAVVGPRLDDTGALARLIATVESGPWRWAGFQPG